MAVEQNLPSRVEMRVVIRNRFTLREILDFPKPKSALLRYREFILDSQSSWYAADAKHLVLRG